MMTVRTAIEASLAVDMATLERHFPDSALTAVAVESIAALAEKQRRRRRAPEIYEIAEADAESRTYPELSHGTFLSSSRMGTRAFKSYRPTEGTPMS